MIGKNKDNKIKLKYSIPVKAESGNDVEVSVLTFGRIKGKHLELLPKGYIENEGKNTEPYELFPLISGLTGIPLEAIREIDLEDLTDVIGTVYELLGKSQQTGGSQSGS